MKNLTERKPVKLSPRDMEKFASVSPSTYPQEMPCAVCGSMWMNHRGMLCPLMPFGLLPVEVESGKFEMVAVMPIYGDSLFVPDLDYYKDAPFEVE